MKMLPILCAALLALTSSAFSQPLKDVSIATGSNGFATFPPMIAKELGLFEKHGLNAKIIVSDSGTSATTALLSRSTDAASLGTANIIAALAAGQQPVILANLSLGASATVILSKSAIEKLKVSPTAPAAERLKALDGLLIASGSPTSMNSVALVVAAKTVGANIRWTYMGPDAMPAALATGAIQGYITGAPVWLPSVQTGAGLVWLSGPKGEFPPNSTPTSSSGFVAMRDFVDKNPDTAQRLAAVFADYVKVLNERPNDFKAALSRAYPSFSPADLDVLFAAESGAWKISPLTVDDVKRDIAFMKASGIKLQPEIDSVDPAKVLFQAK